MAKKLTQAQKSLNKLINRKALIVAQISRTESRLVQLRLQLSDVEHEIGTVHNERPRISTLNEQEKAMCHARDYIGAIKSLRGRSTPYLGLKEAKDIVDAYRDTLPNGGR